VAWFLPARSSIDFSLGRDQQEKRLQDIKNAKCIVTNGFEFGRIKKYEKDSTEKYTKIKPICLDREKVI
jgi:hypothetical protein